MRTRSSLEYTIPRRRNRRRSRQQQEAIPLIPDPIPMADDRPMAEQLQAPTGGFESAIVVPPINAQNFELKSSLINLVQNRIFRGGMMREPQLDIRHFEEPLLIIKGTGFNPFSSTTVGDENPIRTLGDYSKPSHEGYRNTIKILIGNNVIPLRSDTIRLVQNGCSFHGLRSEDPNQHLKDFLKLADSLDLDGENRERTRLLRMTKVIKRELEKPEDLNDEDVSLTCSTSLEVFNNEFNRMSEMDDDLFSYEVEVANIPCDSNKDDDSEQQVLHEADDDTGYDPSDVAFTEWLWSKKFNYKTIDHYRKKALWIYWIIGDDKVELTDEEFSDNEDEVTEVFRIDTNIFDFETPMCKTFKEFNYLLQINPDLLTKDIEGFKTYEEYKDDWIYEWNKYIPWVDEKPWTDVCNMRRFEMIKYSFGQDEEYVAVKEDEYDDLARTSDDACRAYQEIFRMMDE
ncbi:hypothetical protein Tco_0853826 [Tanacetum coccineum]